MSFPKRAGCWSPKAVWQYQRQTSAAGSTGAHYFLGISPAILRSPRKASSVFTPFIATLTLARLQRVELLYTRSEPWKNTSTSTDLKPSRAGQSDLCPLQIRG